MVSRHFKKQVLCSVLAIAMFFGAAGEGAVYTKASSDGIVTDAAGKAVKKAEANTADNTGKQEISTLIGDGKFTVSDPDVSMSVFDEGNGVLIKGNKDNITGSVFTFKNEFDFGTAETGCIVVDGLADKKKKVSLEFYLDDSKTSFATVKLNCLKRDNYWDYSKNACASIKNSKIKGKHKISFKVVTDDKNNVKFLLRYIFFMKSTIPVINFDIDETQGPIAAMDNDINHNTECYGKMSLEVPDDYKSEYTGSHYASGTFDLEYIRGRGNSTWGSEKKPYKFKLKNSTDLFGMGANKHWVLLANYYDASMLRNKLTYWLGSQVGMAYTPQCVFVDVIMNNHYLGSYYLCEQIRVGKSRVDIDNLEDDKTSQNAVNGSVITGGYLLAMSPYTDNDTHSKTFKTERSSYVIQSPGFDDYFNEAQYNYIADYMQKVENAIYGKDFKDSGGKYYGDYMDIDSAADYYWVQEISDNGDAFYTSSTYLYKKRNGKLYWGPLWDFDYVAWGSTSTNVTGFNKTRALYFEKMLQDSAFIKKLTERWPVFREKLLYACKDGGQLDQYAKELSSSQKADFYVNGQGGAVSGDNPGEDTFQTEVNRLKKWVSDRVAWIDSNINSLAPSVYKVTFMSDGNVYSESRYASNSSEGIVFPEEPSKNGYKFKGWYYMEKTADGKEKETKAGKNMTVSADTVFYAKWIAEKDIVKPSGISFAMDDYYYFTNDIDAGLPVYTIPFDAEVPEVTYKSSNENVVCMSDGNTVVAGLRDMGENAGGLCTKAEGDAVITATTADGLTATCRIHVRDSFNEDRYVYDFSIADSMAIKQGEYGRIVPEFARKETPFLNYGYYSSDKSIAEVNGAGYVYAKKAGTVYIAVKCNRGEDIQFCKVTITAPVSKTETSVKKGQKFTSGNLNYEVTKTGKTGNVKCTGMVNKSSRSITIPATVTFKNNKFKVTAIAKSAFEDSLKLKKAVIGTNVTTVGAKAFYNCKLLVQMDIKSSKITKVGKNAIKNVPEGFVLNAPDGKYDDYAGLFGMGD